MLVRVYATSFLSVCLCDTCVHYIKTAKRFIKILLPPDSPISLVFLHRVQCLTPMPSPITGASNTGGVRKLGHFFTNKLVYLGNGARYSHSHNRSWIWNHTQGIKWWNSRWPWLTPLPGLKVTIVWSKYLAHSPCYGCSCYRTRIRSCTEAT